ncbi:MAG TPA: cytochrome c [Thermoanaerobaculia bacterium]|nr:cytochrome c [Thermoanaerobaculia bacterium]
MKPTRSLALLALVPALLAALSGCDLILQRSEGEKLWRKHCAECHGIDGSGNTPRYMGDAWADLRDDAWRVGGDRSSIENVVREGVFARMPGYNEKLSSAEIRLIIDYLYQLRGERG